MTERIWTYCAICGRKVGTFGIEPAIALRRHRELTCPGPPPPRPPAPVIPRIDR